MLRTSGTSSTSSELRWSSPKLEGEFQWKFIFFLYTDKRKAWLQMWGVVQTTILWMVPYSSPASFWSCQFELSYIQSKFIALPFVWSKKAILIVLRISGFLPVLFLEFVGRSGHHPPWSKGSINIDPAVQPSFPYISLYCYSQGPCGVLKN